MAVTWEGLMAVWLDETRVATKVFRWVDSTACLWAGRTEYRWAATSASLTVAWMDAPTALMTAARRADSTAPMSVCERAGRSAARRVLTSAVRKESLWAARRAASTAEPMDVPTADQKVVQLDTRWVFQLVDRSAAWTAAWTADQKEHSTVVRKAVSRVVLTDRQKAALTAE